MSATTTMPSVTQATQEYSDVWFESLRQVLEQIHGSPFTLENLRSEADDPYSQPQAGVWLRFSAEKRLRGEQALFVSKPDALALACILMSEPVDASAELDDLHADAAIELLRQAAGTAATALGSKVGGEVELVSRATDRPQWMPAAHFAVRYNNTEISPIGVHLFLDDELAAALEPASPRVDASAVAPRESARSAPPARQQSRPATNVEYLRDVELEVYLRLGERQLLLRDILNLGRGGVVELDKQVHEPVDLLVGQRVVARGELVIVDGNYGLRVSEIASHEDRLESLLR